MSAETVDRTTAPPPKPAGTAPPAPQPTRRAPKAVAPMTVCLWALFGLPRLALVIWWWAFHDAWPVPAGYGLLAVSAFLFLPLTLTVWLISLIGGGLDAVDIVVLGLAVLSDVLTWIAWRFERTQGPSSRNGRLVVADDEDPVDRHTRKAWQQWLDLLALGLPWPGVRLRATLHRWPDGEQLDKCDDRSLRFLSYDSTVRAICFATPAWITGLIAVALVSNVVDDWAVRMTVAAIGPIVTIVLIIVVGSRNAQFGVVLPMVTALEVLYWSGSSPLTTLQMRRLNRSIARAADALQRLPVRLRSTHPAVIGAAAQKAAELNALQDRTSEMTGSTAELTQRLRDDLHTVLAGQWRSLPGRAADSRVQGLNRWQKTGLVAGAAALFGAAAWVGAGGVVPPAVSGPIIAALVGLAMAALIRSGVTPGGLQHAIDLGKDAIELSKAATPAAGGQSKNNR